MSATANTKKDDKQKAKDKARKEFYRIVNERLKARLGRGETYTTTRDLYAGYEKLAREGFGDTPPSQIVAQVLGYATYKGRLFYARHIVTHKAERSGPGRTAPYRLYLRDDAVPPKDYVLVPVETPKDRVAQVIAEKKGAADATVHVTGRVNGEKTPQPEQMADKMLSTRLASVIKAQAEVIDTMLAALQVCDD